MKILYSSVSDISRPCAERTHISNIVNNFAKLGHEVHLLAVRKGDLELHPNVRFHKIFPFINRRFLSSLTLNIQKMHIRSLIERIIRKEEIDLIYERHNRFDYGTRIGHENGIITLIEQNGIPSLEAKLSGANENEVERIEKSEIRKFNEAERIIVQTENMKEYYSSGGICEEKIVVIPNGVNTRMFRPLNQDKCRLDLELDTDSNIIVFVGSFRKYHNLDMIIKSISEIKKEIEKLKIIFIGEAGHHNNIPFHPTINELKEIGRRSGVLNNLVFTGRLSQDFVVKYINAADICLHLPSNKRTKTMGSSSLKLLEYMACGKPLICSNINGLPEDISKHHAGLVINPEIDTISDAVVHLFKNSDFRKEMGMNGVRLVTNKYSWNEIVERTMDVMGGIIMKRNDST